MSASDLSTKEYGQVDLSSLSNPSKAISTHIALEWNLDFEKQEISGWADHSIKILSSGTSQVDFDSSKLRITGDVLVNNVATKHSVAEENSILGTRISVDIPTELQSEGSTFNIRINYSIDSTASAVQWLAPSATKGGVYPYVFTQCQAIHARSLLPCMDAPGVKTTYSARVTAPAWCTVLMSALDVTPVVDSSADAALGVFEYNQPVPTSAYLIALAAGNLASRDISERVRVWAEPEVVDAAFYEFGETEDFLAAAESITGQPYVWTRYDVLCLPPSFPYGGMENPCLTFATPTLLAGDRSLADVIAHEIAHSWTGNLVTNATWAHFWLNEGWTVWLERKIGNRVKGGEEGGKLSAQIGWKALNDDIQLLGVDGIFTSLVSPNDGNDPDEAFSRVPYEKGFNLLNQLEQLIGSENFSLFAQSYIQAFKFTTVTSGQFRDHFVSFVAENAMDSVVETAASDVGAPLVKKGSAYWKNKKNMSKKDKAEKAAEKAAIAAAAAAGPVVTTIPAKISPEQLSAVNALDWTQLLHGRGLPLFVPDFSNSLEVDAKSLAFKWITAAASATVVTTASAHDVEGWSTQQTSLFLEILQNYPKEQDVVQEGLFTDEWLKAMDAAYSFTARKNAEIQLRWQALCLRSNVAWIVQPVVDFVSSQGRMKFVRPLYRELRASQVGREIAAGVFEQHKDSYHPIARKMLASDLQKVSEMEAAQNAEEEGEGEEATISSSRIEEGDEAETLASSTQDNHASSESKQYDNSSLPTDATVVGSYSADSFPRATVEETNARLLNHFLVLSPSQDNMSILTTDEPDIDSDNENDNGLGLGPLSASEVSSPAIVFTAKLVSSSNVGNGIAFDASPADATSQGADTQDDSVCSLEPQQEKEEEEKLVDEVPNWSPERTMEQMGWSPVQQQQEENEEKEVADEVVFVPASVSDAPAPVVEETEVEAVVPLVAQDEEEEVPEVTQVEEEIQPPSPHLWEPLLPEIVPDHLWEPLDVVQAVEEEEEASPVKAVIVEEEKETAPVAAPSIPVVVVTETPKKSAAAAIPETPGSVSSVTSSCFGTPSAKTPAPKSRYEAEAECASPVVIAPIADQLERAATQKQQQPEVKSILKPDSPVTHRAKTSAAEYRAPEQQQQQQSVVTAESSSSTLSNAYLFGALIAAATGLAGFYFWGRHWKR